MKQDCFDYFQFKPIDIGCDSLYSITTGVLFFQLIGIKGMAVKTQSLVSLIGSMSPVEKAYFKKFGFKKEGTGMSKMLAMFDICEKQPADTPVGRIEELFEKAGIERVALYRNRLFDAVTQSLREYQSSKSDEEDLYHKYQMADILISRGLLKEAESILSKAIAKADSLLLLEHSLLLEHKKHVVSHGLGKRMQVSEGIEKRRKTAMNLSLQMHLANIYEEVYGIQLNEGRNPKGISVLRLKQLAREVELIEIGQLDIKGTMQRCNILHTIYFNLGDNEKCLHYSSKTVDLFNQNPAFKASRSRPYLLSLYNYLSDCLNAKRADLYLKKVSMLKDAAGGEPNLAKEAQSLGFSLQLDYLLLSGSKKEVMDFMKEQAVWYTKEKDSMRLNNLLDYNFRLAYLLYKNGFLDEALDQIAEFYNVGKLGIRPDLDLQISVIEITIHYELGNRELASYKQKALYQRSRNDIASMPSINQYIGCLSKLLRDNRKEPELAILEKCIENAPAETDRNLGISPLLMVNRLLGLFEKVN